MSEQQSPYRIWPIITGLLLAAAAWWFLPVVTSAGGAGLSEAGRAVACIGVLMAVWWMTEALPIEITGLVPLAAFPLLGAVSIEHAAAAYADKIIFLFLGGMLLGQAMEVWGLHKRFALSTIAFFGSRPSRLVGAFLFSTAAVSMFVSNTAATIMMLPIGASVATWVKGHLKDDFSEGAHKCRAVLGPSIVLAIAFGASIGGVGTVIGTPPIAQFAAFMKGVSHEVTFVEWLKIGLPTLALVLPLAWLVLTQVVFRIPLRDVPGVRQELRGELRALGRMSQAEWAVLVIFGSAAACWVGSRWLEVDDSVIAIAAAVLLFAVPVRDTTRSAGMMNPPVPIQAGIEVPAANARGNRALLTWREAERVPWGILLLFGGGLSLAAAIKETKVDLYIAQMADGLTGVPLLPLLWLIALVTIVLTEFTSNTALVAAGLPVAAAIAGRLDIPPAAILVTVALTASLGFMLPAGTAPNALVFASGHVTMRQMMKAGFLLDLSCAFFVPLLVIAAMKLGVLPGL